MVRLPTFSVDILSNVMLSKPPAPRLRAMLREVTVGARQLFFGTLKDGPGQGHWIARPYGIDEEKAAMELVDLALGEMRDDPSLVLKTYRNDELLTALSGYPTKQGWKKKYIVKYILENAREVMESLTAGKRVLALYGESNEEGAAQRTGLIRLDPFCQSRWVLSPERFSWTKSSLTVARTSCSYVSRHHKASVGA
jgi:hypothetical protein